MALLLAFAHVCLAWSQVGVFWGDAGVWRDMVARTAAGEAPYRDFYVHVPPLAIWLLAALGSAFGATLETFWVGTATVAVLFFAAFAAWTGRLLGGSVGVLAIVAGGVWAVATSTSGGSPLASGMYNPAVPVGATCLLAALACAVAAWERPGWRNALGLGVFVALCGLAKQDFWPPALLVGGAIFLRLCVARDGRALLALIGGAALVAAPAIAEITRILGPSGVFDIATGFGMATESGFSRAYPSGQRLTVELLTAGLWVAAWAGALGATGAISRRRGALVAGIAVLVAVASVATYVSVVAGEMDALRAAEQPAVATRTQARLLPHVRRGSAPLPAAIRLMREDAIDQAIPPFLPLIAAAAFAAARGVRRRDALAWLLLAAAFTAHLRRGFEGSDWYHFAIEIPLYASLSLRAFGSRSTPALILLLASLGAAGAYAHWRAASGHLTRAGAGVVTETAAGRARLAGGARLVVELTEAMDRIDPSRERPVISFGHNGGFGYFTGRRNPTPLTLGFSFARDEPEAIVRAIRALDPPAFLIDNHTFGDAQVPSLALAPLTWDAATHLNRYARIDRAYFDRLSRDCERVLGNVFVLYDCPGATER